MIDARRIIEVWRQDYNTARPDRAFGYLTPEEFEQLSQSGVSGKQQAEPRTGCRGGAVQRRSGA